MVRFAPGTTYVLASTSRLVRERVDPDDPSRAAGPDAGREGGAAGRDAGREDRPDAPVAAPDLARHGGSPPTAAPDPAEPAPPVDPFDDADALEELGCEIATLAAHIHAATARLLELIAEFDERRGWELGGHRSCAEWLAFRTGIALGAAREKVRTARALAGLPGTSASMARGELSFSKVRALTRVATPDTEADLLELARGCTTAQLERVVRAWRKGSREDEALRERALWQSRTFSVFPDDEGMYVVKGRLPAEVGALLMRAVEAASDALYREEQAEVADGTHGSRGARERCAGRPEGPDGGSPADPGAGRPVRMRRGRSSEASRREAARRRADAVGLLAERALGAGFGSRTAGTAGADDLGGRTDADDPSEADVPVSGTRAERYQVMLHVEPTTLAAEGEGEPGRAPTAAGGWSELEDGTRVSAETSRRLACDAAVVRVTHGEASSSLLSVGRRTRTIPPALRRALEVRDRGCRFPGCNLRFTDAHHVKHWADGGETSLANCLLLCRHHHRLVHEEGWQVGWWGEGRPVFFDPRGGAHYEGRWEPPGGSRPPGTGEPRESGETPQSGDPSEPGEAPEPTGPRESAEPPEVGRPPESRSPATGGKGARPAPPPAGALCEQNQLRGVCPDGWTASGRWKREHDIPDRVLFAALEAVV